ncbi:3-hydroxyacyl-CoA dehydrogenase NAD-binding domain-containing protein [Ornithinibacillus xuwenensis]|uniref:3-hydroxyacyl-CoA dehydrogenase NAD-binding domain-containing protein n=1 Tax=Ornithinibacillus xuwenensis TaxID=3144668 RepID=A0ABU9XPB1_9BACI
MQDIKLMIIGAGQMGTGIAQVFLQQGFNVTLTDHKQENIHRATEHIQENLNKLVLKERLTTNEMEQLLVNLNSSIDLQVASEMDFIIEAISENATKKFKLLSDLGNLVKEDAIIASNTSSFSITELSTYVINPERFIGMHFFNPVPVMDLIEVVKGVHTSEQVSNFVFELGKKLEKSPFYVNDSPGFVLNRILIPMINEAVFAVHEGVADFKSVDTIMKLGANHPMGPISLADFIGLDTCLAIMETLHEELGDDKYRPCPLLRKYVRSGKLGRKTGEGFFHYK